MMLIIITLIIFSPPWWFSFLLIYLPLLMLMPWYAAALILRFISPSCWFIYAISPCLMFRQRADIFFLSFRLIFHISLLMLISFAADAIFFFSFWCRYAAWCHACHWWYADTLLMMIIFFLAIFSFWCFFSYMPPWRHWCHAWWCFRHFLHLPPLRYFRRCFATLLRLFSLLSR